MRVIQNYNPEDITLDFINGNDWDFIVLNKKVNVEQIKQYWHDVSTKLEHLRFNFFKDFSLLKPIEYKEGNPGFTTDQSSKNFHITTLGDKRKISTYTFTWPIQRDIPLPPPWACDIKQFPELSEFVGEDNQFKKDTDHHSFVMLEQYMFGEFKNIWDEWGKDFLVNTRISMHEPGMIVPLHKDGHTTRIHIPMTDDSSKFYWGECWDRSYDWEVGNIYLINSHITHSTSNLGPNIRANILTSVDTDKIPQLLRL